MKTILLSSCLALFFATTPALAEKSTLEEAKDGTMEAGRDLKKGVRKTWRNAKNEVCEMVNGKVECAVKKAKNKAKNAIDEVEDKVE